MKKPLFLGALLASVVLVGCLDDSELDDIEQPSDSDPAEMLGEVSSALASGCSHTSFVHKPSQVQGQGAVSCNAIQSEINVDVMLRRNGTNVRHASSRCFDTRSCFARANHPDSAGSQRWCAVTLAGTPLFDHTAPTHCVSF